MDIRKERKAFEEYLISQGVDLKYIPSIHFNGCIYDQGDDFDEDQQEALGEINLGWNAWQAAKAQAVPEGFVLVPKEPTLEMIAKGHDVFVGAFDSKLNGGQSLHCAYLAMIEALEQAND